KYNMTEPKIHILLDNKIEKEKMKQELSNMSNIEDFEFDEINEIKNIIECEEETIDKFMEEEIIGSHEVDGDYAEIKENRYNEEFVMEIEKGLLQLKRKLLKFGDEENQDLIQECYNDIKKINSISLSIKQPVIENLTKVVLEIINRYKEEHINLESRLIDFILDLVDLGLRWSENPELDKNIDYMNEVQKQTGKMEEYILEQEIDPEDKIGEILKKISNLTDEDIKEIQNLQKENPNKKFGEIAVDSKKVNEEDTIKAIRLQKRKRSTSGKPKISISDYIRVDSKKADELVENVGELKIIQTQVEHLLLNNLGVNSENRKARHNNMKKVVRMQRVMKKIQEISMSFRLVPLRSTFQKINRTVRDTLNKLDKDVNFKMSGEETEIDKEIADKILKLIMHLVKNSLSHGIESPEERVKKGKSKKGNVELSAYQDKGFIHIQISDDGKGIDGDKIYESAKKKGIIDPEKNLADQEKIKLIFYPGFSTAKEVGSISGRGVGMDVVKTDLEKMGGKINIETEIDKGTVFEMKIPINMSIINGTVINISNQSYIMPNIYIKEVVRKKDEYWVDVKGKRNTIKIRDKIIPVIDLEKIFDHKVNVENAKMFMILEVEDKTRAILVDEILERREVVEKPLGEEFKHLEYVSGASILGDGKVSLIINAEKL
ncbi:MAG: chemotaxis protein CheA, partial [Fusobacteriota bacterium]